MAKINRYVLKVGTTTDELTQNGFHSGGTWINKRAELYKSKCISYHGTEFSISIAFPKRIEEWDDFVFVLVLDEDFGQPYTPFYHHYGDEVSNWPYLEYVIHAYNEFMDSVPFLERTFNI